MAYLPHSLIFCVSLWLAAGLLVGCGPHANEESQAGEDRLKAKHAPLDEYLDLRLGVDDGFELEAYMSAIKEAVRANVQRASARPENEDALQLPWRVEGPTNLGGRVNALAVDPRDPAKVYLGYSRGGLWGTQDEGASWEPLTEELPFPTIGAIAIDTSTSRLWIGTGDPNISGYWHIGSGAYYSEDDGASWTQAGLEFSGVINKLIVDPNDSDVVFAAVMGKPYAGDDERGVYKTTDRGATWENIFFIDQETGISDLWMSAANPDVLYATAWPRVRNLSRSVVRGDEAQLYRSIDGGDTWESLYDRMNYDLPASRLGFAIAPSNPDVLYMSVCGNDLRFDVLLRSDDGGDSWVEQSYVDSPGWPENPFSSFGWFFGQTRVDPLDANHLWVMGVRLWESFDGGITWSRDENTDGSFFIHADKHAMEINPAGQIWLGTDGGAYRQPYGGAFWFDAEDIPTNMFYRVADYPLDTLNFAGGMQDNGSAIGSVDIDDAAWYKLFGGDGFQPSFAPEQPTAAIVETQRGRLWYVDDSLGLFNEVTPPHADEKKSWDMPVARYYDIDADYTWLLTASNFPYEGDFEEEVFWVRSDVALTSDTSNSRLVATAAHIAIDETRWLGTSEGWLWRRLEDSNDWERITTGFPERYITDVTTVPNNPSVVYVTMSWYYNGDRTPYLIRSEDGGQTWVSAQGDLPMVALNSMLSIPATNDSVRIVASDVGVYASIDAGETYQRLGTGMTNVPVFDLAYDTVSQRLIAGTFGRSVQTYPLGPLLNTVPDTVDVSAQTPFARIKNLRVSPNPASEVLRVSAVLKEVSKPASLSLFDQLGKQVLTREYAAGQARLDVALALPSDLASGTYTLVLRNRHDEARAKVVIR